MERASNPRLRQSTRAQGMGSPEGEGRAPTLTKEGLWGRPPSPAPPPPRVRRKRRKCGICPQDEEETGCFLKPGQSSGGNSRPMQGPPQSASPECSASPPKLLFSKDIEPGDPGGSWVECPLESEFESLLFSKSEVQPGSLDNLLGFPGLFEPESLSLATQESPQSPTLYPGVLIGDPTEQQEALPRFVVGSPGTSPGLERPEIKGQPVSRMKLGQRLDTWTSSPEPWSVPLEQRRPRHVKKQQWVGPVSCDQKHCTDISQDNPEEASQRDCPRLEEVRSPCGVKLVYYVGSRSVIRLLGAINKSQPGGQLEALEDMMEVSSARRRRRPMTPRPASRQYDPTETEKEELLQPRAEDPGGQDTVPPDAGVRSAVVHALQEVLRSRVQELPDLLLKEEEVSSIAEGIEEALFHLTRDTNLHYKTKYRSLLFNLRDPRNSDLLLRVARCDVNPHDLVRMNSIQLAPQELSRWRDQEERRGLEIIEQQQKELYRLPTSKLTHKGEVEIPRDLDQMLTLEDLMEPMVSRERSPQALMTSSEDSPGQHQRHFWDSNGHTFEGGKGSGKAVHSRRLEPPVGISHSMYGKSSTNLPGFSGAFMNREEDAIQKDPSPAVMSSPEMLRAGETPPKGPQDRLQMPDGPKNTLPSLPPWEGSLDMFSIKHFRAKAQLISGHSSQLIQALPEVIHSAGCIRPNDVWELLDSICPARAKDICVVRLCPHGSRDIPNYRLLYSYLNNKQRHCLAAVLQVRMVLLPLPAFQPLPARLRSLGGPGLEVTHSSLLLAVLFPKDGLPDTAASNPVRCKVPKTVSFAKKVEIRRYQPEDRRSEDPPRGPPPHEETPKQSLVKGSLAPTGVCAWQSLPRGRGRQEPGWGHPSSAGPFVPGLGRGQHLHRASCFHQDLLQHLKVLMTMSRQFQASLRPPGQEPLLPTSVSEVPEAPGPLPNPSLGPVDGGGFECSLPEMPDPSDPPEQEG